MWNFPALAVSVLVSQKKKMHIWTLQIQQKNTDNEGLKATHILH